MKSAQIFLPFIFILAGCVNEPPSVVLRHEGIRQVARIECLPLEKYPFDRWNQERDEVLKRAGAGVWTRHVTFDTRKRKEWEEFLASYQSSDTVFQISGSRIPELFSYFVIVRAGKELRRYYVLGGDGQVAVE